MDKSSLNEWLEKRGIFFWMVLSILLVGLLGICDYSTGTELGFSLFYLIPISLIAWYSKPALGVLISILSAVVWLYADIEAGQEYSNQIFFFWNTLIRLGFFIIVTYLISELKRSQKIIQESARTDYATGTLNARRFHEILEGELQRSRRNQQPFTLIYLDLDNFKQVNSQFGHNEGDRLIRLIAAEIRSKIRSTDFLARLGGDEFAILFPEAGQHEAEAIISKVHDQLSNVFRDKFSFVTFSAGAVTYESTPHSSAETIRIADELMYIVKNGTKNDIRYLVYTEDSAK